MKTLLQDANQNKNAIVTAAEILSKGEVVAIPTETVYGLAANALSEKSVEKIFKAKGRPSDNPLIVHVSSMKMMHSLVTHFPKNAVSLVDAFWPGALTIILKKSDIVPYIVSAGLDTVGIRFPSHEVARDIIDACGFPLAAPSANTSGFPSPTKASHVLSDMDGKIPLIVDGGDCNIGVESTVVDLSGEVPILLRPGGVSLEDLREVLSDIVVDPAINKEIEKGEVVRSPGMKYRHYAPKAPLTIVRGEFEDTAEYIRNIEDKDIGILCFDEYKNTFLKGVVKSFGGQYNKAEQSRELFDGLRFFDSQNVTKIYAQCPSTEGIGLAVCNRMMKAAGFNVLDVKGEV